jgi:DNA-binding IclR family transcriptional regulator
LTRSGFLKQDPFTKRYSLGLKLFELGMLQVETLELNQKGFAPAGKVSQDTRLICRLGLWDSGTVLVTATVRPLQKGASMSQVGPRVPAYCSALGKAVLAYFEPKELGAYLAEAEFEPFTHSTILDKNVLLKDLEETRLRGYSIDREEAVWGMACVGSPVYEGGGTIIGAVSLSGSPRRVLKPEKVSGFGQRVMETAGEISQSLGFLPGRPPVARVDRRSDFSARAERADGIQSGFSAPRNRA